MIAPADLAQLPGRSNPIYLEGKLLPLTVAQARELDLRDGQVIQAMVQSRGGDNLSLLMRGKLMEVPSSPVNNGWQVGQNLTLQVQSGATGLFLQMQPEVAQPQGAASYFSRVGNLLFRPPGLEQLGQLFKPGVLDALFQASGRTDLQGQWRSMQLSMAQLDPQQLAQAINRAVVTAMGSELRLFKGQPVLPDDPKQLLRKLMAALSGKEEDEEGSVLDALGKLGQAVDDLESSQVQAVQAQAQKEMLISLMLPFVDADPIEVQFRRAPRKDGDERPPLTVNVHSRSQEIGEVWLKTQLHGLDRVELTMWAMREGVAEQARARSAELGTQLSEAGLAMQSFQVIHGARPIGAADWVPSGRGLVIDIRA
ncbi:MAG: hypothetical protein WCK08_09900 [Betaproteobacteria bacterium]